MTPVPFLDVAAGNRELHEELAVAFRTVVEGPTLISGEQLSTFEAEFAAAVGARHCVGVGSGFDALELALRALGVGSGDEVIVPTNTYVATWLAVSAVGARPVGVEPLEGTSNLDPSGLDAAVTPRTAAVLPVHLYGQPADMDAIGGWASQRGIPVVVDAAQAHGARHGGRAVGALGDVVAWSFYPTKNLGCLGDGGAVTTDDPDLAGRVRRLGSYGSSERDVHVTQGVNSRLDELQAAFLRVKLPRLEVWNARRQAHAHRYLAELAGLELTLPEVADGAVPVWHQFVIRVPDRPRVRAALADAGVATMVHYPTPPFAQPAFADLGKTAIEFPVATRLADEVLSLPVGPHLRDDDQTRVIDALAALR